MNNASKKSLFQKLLRNTVGNGEVVGVLVAAGIAVTAGYAAVNSIGNQAKDTGAKQATAIKGLPGN